ncbi:MAG: SDR family oxidoreductase [Smithellaceae bacterium]|nr:SDR family oxidoreductase [Smithellaceae bacterium]
MKIRSFNKKVIVVTGAASGIGEAISRRVARDGARLGLLDQDEAAVKAFAAELGASGVEALGLGCDVSQEEECEQAISVVLQRYGGIDVLVNNAGITQRGAFVDTETKVYRRVMEVNFFGSLHCTKAAIGSLLARRGMVIVVESLAGVAPLLGRTGYCASKHALHGLFTSLRAELRGRGLHVMLVCPGFVMTNLQTRVLGADGQVATHPQSLVGRPTSASSVAEEVYRGALKRRNLLVLTPVGKLSYWFSRLAPVAYERLMARMLREELL